MTKQTEAERAQELRSKKIEDTPYGFDATQRKLGLFSRHKFDLNATVRKFATRLELTNPLASDALSPYWKDDARKIFLRYVRQVHRNIFWYTAARNQEVFWYRIYVFFTLLAVVGVPLLAFAIPTAHVSELLTKTTGSEVNVPTSATVSAQITALIAGIYGVHRLGSSWLFRRNNAHAFWKAGNQLRNMLHGLEEKWVGNIILPNGEMDRNFVRELEEAGAQVRAIKGEEEDTFFSSYENIKTDLQATVSDSLTGAEKVVSALSQPILKKAVDEEKRRGEAKAAINKVWSEVVGLRTKRIEYDRSMRKNQAKAAILKPGPAKDSAIAQAQADGTMLAAVNGQLIEAQAALTQARASLTGA